MALLDKLKQVVTGRSEMVEKGIDLAVGQVNRRTKHKYSGTLTKQATQLKGKARQLDAHRTRPDDGPGRTGTPPIPPA